jgi:tetrahydromethanopterin S-methyltransferase subunit F
MTAFTESDIKELKDLMIVLQQEIQKLQIGQVEIQRDIKRIEIGQAEIKAKVEGLDKRVDDINSRLNIMTVGFLSIVGVMTTGISGIIDKVVFFPNP